MQKNQLEVTYVYVWRVEILFIEHAAYQMKNFYLDSEKQPPQEV